MSIKTENTTDLGFLEECEPWLLTNKYFPSKIGGLPSWLELLNIPTINDLSCGVCSNPCIFLCQVYAPGESVECFHRTIYVFICKKEECCQSNSNKNILVFRNQLPRSNNFYSFDPPNEENETEGVKSPIQLCRICGCRGPMGCSKCKKVQYCGPLHQRIDWKEGHKKECSVGELTDRKISPFLFPEFEMVTEPEEELNPVSSEPDEEAEKRNLQEFKQLTETENASELQEIPDSELMKFTEEEDFQFSKFKKQIEKNPEQILRYNKNGSPLWISSENILKSDDVPDCELCGSKRCFEFQIMPQLLNHFNKENLDWGIIAIYTCEESCSDNLGYYKEFAYKQDLIVKIDENEEKN